VKVHDRVESGEMPPKKKPPAEATAAALRQLRENLIAADRSRAAEAGRAALRRLTRTEFENTVRDLANLARQFTVYATGREVRFADRAELAEVVAAASRKGGGIRTLIHELVASPLFQNK
jgi:DNA-binding NtrC family response regulator